MKTVVVVSDTHGNMQFIQKMYPIFAENDYIIHLGDGCRDMSEIYRAFPEKTYVCQGNCDFSSAGFAKSEWEIEIENCKIFCSHGHRYGVKYGIEEYQRVAVERGCNVALYGHTHQARADETEGCLVLNPGNATPYSTRPSYAYLVIQGSKITATIVPVQP